MQMVLHNIYDFEAIKCIHVQIKNNSLLNFVVDKRNLGMYKKKTGGFLMRLKRKKEKSSHGIAILRAYTKTPSSRARSIACSTIRYQASSTFPGTTAMHVYKFICLLYTSHKYYYILYTYIRIYYNKYDRRPSMCVESTK